MTAACPIGTARSTGRGRYSSSLGGGAGTGRGAVFTDLWSVFTFEARSSGPGRSGSRASRTSAVRVLPHLLIALSGACSVRPRSVSSYSTRGGTSAKMCRESRPSRSRSRRVSVSTFPLIPSTAARRSRKRVRKGPGRPRSWRCTCRRSSPMRSGRVGSSVSTFQSGSYDMRKIQWFTPCSIVGTRCVPGCSAGQSLVVFRRPPSSQYQDVASGRAGSGMDIAQVPMASRTARSPSPSSVSRYSTRGGISGYEVRVTIP